MKQIDCKNGLFALVDDDDFSELNKYKWKAKKRPKENTYYAYRWFRVGDRKLDRKKQVSMHRHILNLTNPKELCDHINRNGLDNRRCNLRKCTHSQNCMNKTKMKNKSSKYLGVSINDNGKKKYWTAHIKGKCISWQPYTPEGEIKCAKAYDKKAKIMFGEFANLNFK